MGKLQFCRICRTKNNLKYTPKELKLICQKQLLLCQGTHYEVDGIGNTDSNSGSRNNSKASQKLLRTTPVLGNICHDCDERLQIFHNLDDDTHDLAKDDKDGIVSVLGDRISTRSTSSSSLFMEERERADTPIIVDDDDMLHNLFLQKVERQRKLQQQQQEKQLEQEQESHINATIMPLKSHVPQYSDYNHNERTVHETLHHQQQQQLLEQIDCNGHRVIAFVDLVENEKFPLRDNLKNINNNQKCPSKSKGHNLTADVKVVSPCFTPKRRKRKNYNESEFHVVASFNLISSDSETEELKVEGEVVKVENKNPDKAFALNCISSEHIRNPNSTANIIIPPTFASFNCKHCRAIFNDQESLNVHARSHLIIKCPACHMTFAIKQHLVHHMRYKHREYNGHVLVERPRVPQDSAMTIRLRYMQRLTFYECQLCGHIDEVFKYHKEHIIQKHSNESKFLKDPIMNQLKCPVCKVECGYQYLTLCRHLLSCHEAQQYKNHIREIFQVSAFSWSSTRQNEMFETAHVYQFTKRKTFFFECKLCHKVVAGYLHHMRHLRSHKTTRRSKTTTTTTDEVNQKVNDRKLELSCDSSINNNRNNNDTRYSKIFLKSKEIVNESSRLENKPKLKLKCAKNNSNKSKRRQKQQQQQREQQQHQLHKEKSSLKQQALPQPKVTKIQRSPSLLRLIPLQTFKCKFCSKKFNGNRLLNLHLIQKHANDEFYKCNDCDQTFMCMSKLKKHLEQRDINENIYKGAYKRKCHVNRQMCYKQRNNNSEKVTSQLAPSISATMGNELVMTTIDGVIEKCSQKDNNFTVMGNPEDYHNSQWFQDLLLLHVQRNGTVSFTCSDQTTQTAAVQCLYCLKLFRNVDDLQQHSKLLHSNVQNILIRRERIT